jgi:transposase
MGRVEIFHGRPRRRWSEEDKRRLVAETFGPGATVHGVARRHGVSPSQLFAWRKLYRSGAGIERAVPAPPGVPGFAAVEIAPATPPSVADVVPAPSGLIEIELAGGDRVRISGAADPAVVMAALRALAGR